MRLWLVARDRLRFLAFRLRHRPPKPLGHLLRLALAHRAIDQPRPGADQKDDADNRHHRIETDRIELVQRTSAQDLGRRFERHATAWT